MPFKGMKHAVLLAAAFHEEALKAPRLPDGLEDCRDLRRPRSDPPHVFIERILSAFQQKSSKIMKNPRPSSSAIHVSTLSVSLSSLASTRSRLIGSLALRSST